MRFYTRQHRHYCGRGSARALRCTCACRSGRERFWCRDIASAPSVSGAHRAYREDLRWRPECMFTWYTGWRTCARERAWCVLGHAL